MRRFVTIALAAIAAALPLQAGALCDIGGAGARVIHAQSTPFNSAATLGMVYWVAPATTAPTFYYVFATSNQSYINLLNAALVSGKQVRVTGSAAACPAEGLLRPAGTVVGVFMDTFQ
jgi:hypothetical protein